MLSGMVEMEWWCDGGLVFDVLLGLSFVGCEVG